MATLKVNLNGTIDYAGSHYVKELTCSMSPAGYATETDAPRWHCSLCGSDNAGVWSKDGNLYKPLYCPSCRAKVVG